MDTTQRPPTSVEPASEVSTPTRPSMDARLRARRIEVLRSEGRQRLRRLLIAVVVTVLLLATWGVTRSPLLDVDAFTLSGNQNTSDDELIAQSGLALGDALVDLKLDQATEALLLLPWVDHAEIHRSWSGRIEIRVTEPLPVAIVQDEQARRWLIAADATVLGPSDSYVQASDASLLIDELAVIRGVVNPTVGEVLEGVPNTLISLVTSIPSELARLVQTVYLDTNQEIWFELSDGGDESGPGGRIRFGDARAPLEQLRSANLVITQVDLSDLDVIDVRVPSDPVVTRLEPGAQSQPRSLARLP